MSPLGTITGFPDAAGVVEGRVRVIACANEGDQSQVRYNHEKNTGERDSLGHGSHAGN